jgi:methionyl aminopeptidase
MIIIKEQHEIDLIRKAGEIIALCKKELENFIQIGISTQEIDDFVDDFLKSHNAKSASRGYQGYPACTCISVNEYIVHGIPSHYKLVEGDIVSVDITASYNRYIADSCYSYAVGEISKEKQHLLTITQQALYAGIAEVGPGNRLSNISHAIETVAKKNSLSVVKDFSGHGVGRRLHEEPTILNYGKSGRGPTLKEGMVIAIEPIFTTSTTKVNILSDGWSAVSANGVMAAHFEHTVLVTDSGYDILT